MRLTNSLSYVHMKTRVTNQFCPKATIATIYTVKNKAKALIYHTTKQTWRKTNMHTKCDQHCNIFKWIHKLNKFYDQQFATDMINMLLNFLLIYYIKTTIFFVFFKLKYGGPGVPSCPPFPSIFSLSLVLDSSKFLLTF